MSKIFAIARLTNNKSLIGLRIADVSEKNIKFKDVPIASIKNVLASGGITLQNVGLVDGNVVGTNGSIDRLAEVDLQRGLVGNSPLVVINRIGEVGYTVIDYKGVVKKASNADTVNYAKRHGIANGKVIVKDNLEYISSISGEYDVQEISASKLGNKKSVSVGLTLNHDTRSVARHAAMEVGDEIDNNDIFKSMTKEQKKAIQDYYMWYTVSIYEGMARGMRFSLKNTARGLYKAEVISQLRGEDDWEFAGIRDCGFQGASQCQLGHSLRYEYYAVAKDEQGNEIDRIIFGETCAGDFFDISKEDMAKLVKTRMMMTEEIKLITDIAANHMEKQEWADIKLLINTLRRLCDVGGTRLLYDVFGDNIANTLINFLNVDIPFPESLVLSAKRKIYDYGIKDFWCLMYGDYKDTIESMFNDTKYYSLKAIGALYLRYMAQVNMAGKFGYDPTHYERDRVTRQERNLKVGKNDEIGKKFGYGDKVGGFSKNDAQLRRNTMYRIRSYTKCRDFTLDEVESLLKLVRNHDKGVEIAEKWNKKAKDEYDIDLTVELLRADKENDMYDLAHSLVDYKNRPEFNRSYTCRDKHGKYTTAELAEFIGKAQTTEFEDSMKELLREQELAKQKREEEERKRQEEEAKRQETERQEKEAKRQEENKDDANESEDKHSNILEELKELMDKNPNLKLDYNTNIAKNIIERKLKYEDLSFKQKNVIKKAHAVYKEAAEGKKVATEVNDSYTLDEKPQVKEEVEFILSFKDKDEIANKIKLVLPKVFDIAESVKKRNKYSDKQYKHIKAAFNLILVMAD